MKIKNVSSVICTVFMILAYIAWAVLVLGQVIGYAYNYPLLNNEIVIILLYILLDASIVVYALICKNGGMVLDIVLILYMLQYIVSVIVLITAYRGLPSTVFVIWVLKTVIFVLFGVFGVGKIKGKEGEKDETIS